MTNMLRKLSLWIAKMESVLRKHTIIVRSAHAFVFSTRLMDKHTHEHVIAYVFFLAIWWFFLLLTHSNRKYAFDRLLMDWWCLNYLQSKSSLKFSVSVSVCHRRRPFWYSIRAYFAHLLTHYRTAITYLSSRRHNLNLHWTMSET